MHHTHIELMNIALELAERGRYTVSPNPMVGCVIVSESGIVGRGFHQRAGSAHAEVVALQEAGSKALGATAYITLEPCCHYGRTPPCINALIEARIKKVVIATLDPNPLMAGKSIHLLRESGIEVGVGVAESDARALNEIYFHYTKYRRPFVIAKWAMSLDGKTMTHPSDSRQISNLESQKSSHTLRREVDAILIGAQTAIQDDPRLTVRYPSVNEASVDQPLRIVLSSQTQLPLDLKIFDVSDLGKTIVVTTDKADKHWCHEIRKKNIEVWILPQDKQGRVHLLSLLNKLGEIEIASILIEGGNQIHESFFSENLINKVHVYLAPLIIASLEKKQTLTNLKLLKHQSDFHFMADCEENINV